MVKVNGLVFATLLLGAVSSVKAVDPCALATFAGYTIGTSVVSFWGGTVLADFLTPVSSELSPAPVSTLEFALSAVKDNPYIVYPVVCIVSGLASVVLYKKCIEQKGGSRIKKLQHMVGEKLKES